MTRLDNAYGGRQYSGQFENYFAATRCSGFGELALSAWAVSLMRWRLVLPGNVPMLMARWLRVHRCCVDRSAKRINKTRTPALQVKKHHENEQTATSLRLRH